MRIIGIEGRVRTELVKRSSENERITELEKAVVDAAVEEQEKEDALEAAKIDPNAPFNGIWEDWNRARLTLRQAVTGLNDGEDG